MPLDNRFELIHGSQAVEVFDHLFAGWQLFVQETQYVDARRAPAHELFCQGEPLIIRPYDHRRGEKISVFPQVNDGAVKEEATCRGK